MTYLVDGAASRRRFAHRTDLNELERGFVLSIEAKQTVDVGIHEAGEETRRQTEAVSGGREVRQHRAGVPVEMAPATPLILPGVSPEERAEHDGRGAPGEVGLGGRLGERVAHVAVAQSPEREIARAEVIETRRQVLHVPRGDVDLGLVKRAGRRRGAEEDLAAARVGLLPRDTGGEIEKRGEPTECERSTLRTRSGIERAESVDLCEIDVARKWDGGEVRVDLERKRLDVPLERVAARPDRDRKSTRLNSSHTVI